MHPVETLRYKKGRRQGIVENPVLLKPGAFQGIEDKIRLIGKDPYLILIIENNIPCHIVLYDHFPPCP